MSSPNSYKIYQPSASDISAITKMHNDNLKTQQKTFYYTQILNATQNPFFIAVDSEGKLLGYIAAKVEHYKSQVKIVALVAESENSQIMAKLLAKVIKASDKLGAKEIIITLRESSKTASKVLADKKFTKMADGKYKDGENKFKFVRINQEGKNYLVRSYGGYRRDIKPLPKPKEGYFRIVKAKPSNMMQVKDMHNKNLKKQREISYFTKILNMKNSVFYVALDSNKTVVGYVCCRPERKQGFIEGAFTRLNLVSIGVDEKWRGLGIARRLINVVLEKATENSNIEKVYGHVRGSNKSALALYKKAGFNVKKVGIYKDDKDTKYEFYKRIRFPSLTPYFIKYRTPAMWFGFGLIAHEVVHAFRKYEE